MPPKIVKPYDMASGKMQHYGELYTKFVDTHSKSRAYISEYRPVLADNRNIANFCIPFKDAIHPVICKKAKGAYVWDQDDNKVIDLGGGFGPVLFGHNPAFVKDAMYKMMDDDAWGLGFEHEIVGECSKKAAKLIGCDRCTWVSTGTEGTTLALRLGRLKTNKPKVVMFENSYHGHFDGFLGMPRSPDKCLPVSPGIQKGAVEDLFMLPYNTDDSLKWIIERADQIACVFCESVQNRNPAVQPRDFLARLRQICTQYNIVLVFDEVVTGFRIAPGGSQQKLGVRADLCCYGKAIGGGFPVGLVAGFSDVMKGVDGGLWQYGDNSFPKATRTYFAGTFCKHPLIMTAVGAVLDHVIEHGDEFYPQLNANADYLCETINQWWFEKGIALAINHYGSQVRFMIPPDLSLAFFQTLMVNGVYCWEGRTCFLTTCHTREVIDEMLVALKKTTDQLVEAGANFPDLDAQSGPPKKGH